MLLTTDGGSTKRVVYTSLLSFISAGEWQVASGHFAGHLPSRGLVYTVDEFMGAVKEMKYCECSVLNLDSHFTDIV